MSSEQASAPTGTKNSSPTIHGQPGASVLPGQRYSFEPGASDPDGDALTFSVVNLPSWSSFDPSTGRLSGTPQSADIATYTGIEIKVSDGSHTATLGPFSISVTDAGTGTATLSWVPPTENSDGSVLTDLAGYRIMYGQGADDLSQKVSLSNPSLNRFLIENLTSGTWYFAVVAVDAEGTESPLSNLASKTIT